MRFSRTSLNRNGSIEDVMSLNVIEDVTSLDDPTSIRNTDTGVFPLSQSGGKCLSNKFEVCKSDWIKYS